MELTVSSAGETDKEPSKYMTECQPVISAVGRQPKIKGDRDVALTVVARGGLPEKAHFRV